MEAYRAARLHSTAQLPRPSTQFHTSTQSQATPSYNLSSVSDNSSSESDNSSSESDNSSSESDNDWPDTPSTGSSSSSSSSDDNGPQWRLPDYPLDMQFQLKNLLGQWKVRCNIANSHTNKLLKILRQWLPFLPKDSRTLVPAPRNLQLANIDGGQYYHFGLADSLAYQLRNDRCLQDGDVIPLQLNCDGLPVYNSTSKQLWPILGLLHHRPGLKPFMIGVYFGTSQPRDVTQYLADLVQDYTALRNTGLTVNGKNVHVRISTVLCDAPAKAFVKCVKKHTGYGACDKCTVTGVWRGRVAFIDSNAPLRTDASFVAQLDPEHHPNPVISPFQLAGLGE